MNSDRANTLDVLSAWVRDARARTLRLIEDLDDEQLIGPQLPIVNPLLWEIGHAAWFQERWVFGDIHYSVFPALEIRSFEESPPKFFFLLQGFFSRC